MTEHQRGAAGCRHPAVADVVPEPIRAELRTYGLPRDELADTGPWPHQLYTARRHACTGATSSPSATSWPDGAMPTPFGMGGCNVDIREVQWVAAPISRFPRVELEGAGRGLPERSGAAVRDPVPLPPAAARGVRQPPGLHLHLGQPRRLLLVPDGAAVLIAGQAAGAAAALAVERRLSPAAIDVVELRRRLRRRGAILSRRQATADETDGGAVASGGRSAWSEDTRPPGTKLPDAQ